MTDAELDRLTVKELRVLNTRIEDAIRAQIRAKRLGMPAMADAAGQHQQKSIDLEKERDAWLASRR